MNINSLIKIAIKEAKKSSYHQKVGAVIWDKKKIVSVGYNTAMRSVKSATFKYFKRNFSLHAEVSAILNAKCDLRGKNILVVRINNKDKLLNAKPCEYCEGYIEFVKLKSVYYSDKDGVIKKL